MKLDESAYIEKVKPIWPVLAIPGIYCLRLAVISFFTIPASSSGATKDFVPHPTNCFIEPIQFFW